jgi:hypothetical protein
MELFTLSQAAELIGDGATYRVVEYYKFIYNGESDVVKKGGRYFVTRSFIDKVINNRSLLTKKSNDHRTKDQLIELLKNRDESIFRLSTDLQKNEMTIQSLKKKIEKLEKKSIEVLQDPKEIESFKLKIEELESLIKNNEEDYYDRDVRINKIIKEKYLLENRIKELESLVAEYEDSEIFEKAEEGFRVETFSQEEFELFSERLIQWRLQRQEIESTKVHFETLKDEKDFIKGQLDYFKSSNDKILLQHQQLIELIGQRNRIEAVEKGALTKEPREI